MHRIMQPDHLWCMQKNNQAIKRRILYKFRVIKMYKTIKKQFCCKWEL